MHRLGEILDGHRVDGAFTRAARWWGQQTPFDSGMVEGHHDANNEDETDHHVQRNKKATLRNQTPQDEARQGHGDQRPIDFPLPQAEWAGLSLIHI